MTISRYFINNNNWMWISAPYIQTSIRHYKKNLMSKAKASAVRCHGDTLLVTGGAGFLGQHILSLLQTKADHVKQIKVLDLKHYQNRLGHVEDKPVTSIVGSVTDPQTLSDSFTGVHCVYHVAGLISYGTFPDHSNMYKVNVEGTRNVIQACLDNGVERLVFCSTVDVVIGYEDIENGDEDTTMVPKQFLFPGYPDSKFQAESLVLQANGRTGPCGVRLQTVSLRANVMYGEGDPYYVTNGLRSAMRAGNILYRVGSGTALFQPVYVGNTAWAFVCADTAMKRDPTAGGQFYFIPDDTPRQNTFDFMRPFLEVKGYRLSRLKLPFYFVYPLLLLAEYVVKGLSPLIRIHLPAESYSVKYINMTLHFKNDKARRELGFKPLFPPDTAKERSLPYYRDLKL